MTQTIEDFNTILNFWFGKPEEKNYGKPNKFWFIKDTKFDQKVRSKFLTIYQQAAEGNLNHWQALPLSCLALIIILDQFPRNMFRQSPQAFASDDYALNLAQYAINNNFDCQVSPVQRWFIYLPFEHSENLIHQQQSVTLFSQLKDDPDSKSTIDYAYKHLKIIERFGRFPHRNQILGRVSTPEEIKFLQQPGASF
ncbi:MAG: DUF924 family protein [Cyanobacteria bacterium P01_G01_bin.49]